MLIFYLLMFHHPLQGRRELDHACFDRDVERQLFGSDPLFVFDPDDDSNAPDPVVHGAVLQYWPLYPRFIQDDFTRAFTTGLRDPAGRVREGVWRSHLARLLDGILVCVCGRENLTDDGAPLGPCWSCGKALPPPVLLRLGSRVVVLNAGTRVTGHHLRRDYDYSDTVAEVVVHPARPELWGLRNHTGSAWRVTGPDGTEQEVAPGRSLGLVPGASLDLGGVLARIEG